MFSGASGSKSNDYTSARKHESGKAPYHIIK